MPTIAEVNATDSRWRAFCASHPDLTLFQSPSWSSVIGRTYDFSMRVLLVLEEDAVLGGLPFAHIEDFRGPRRVALAFADNVEPLPLALWDTLERSIASDTLPWTIRTTARPSELAANSRAAAYQHTIELPSTFDEARERFHYKHVQNLKQAEKAGLNWRVAADESGIVAFYELHSLVRKNKHGLVPQPRAFFEAIFEEFFPDNGFVLIAEHNDRIVSAMLFLACGRSLYYKFSASALDSLLLRPNHYLITQAIGYAIERGFDKLDLGISDTEGLVRFKDRIGGKATDVYSAAYNPLQKSAGITQVERSLGELTQLLTAAEMPVEAAQRGGDILYRFFT